MKDMPMFTTEYGVASLTLREIPYQKTAYVVLRAAEDPEKLVKECVAFCRAVGAEQVLAAGHRCLSGYPFHTAIWHMRRSLDGLPDTQAALWPVQEETAKEWQRLYNLRMADIPNAAWCANAMRDEMVKAGDGYFVHDGETLLGIGRASGEKLDVVISLQPGAGRDVTLALCHALSGDCVNLEVASENKRAVRLYEKLGFLPVEELSRWYRIV